LKSHGGVAQAEEEMLIGGAEIHVGDHHPIAIMRQHGREVERDDALATPPLPPPTVMMHDRAACCGAMLILLFRPTYRLLMRFA